jgi:hypothetical protein
MYVCMYIIYLGPTLYYAWYRRSFAVVVPFWDLEVGQYSLSAAVSIYLSHLVAEEGDDISTVKCAGGGGGDGRGTGTSCGVGGGRDVAAGGGARGGGEHVHAIRARREKQQEETREHGQGGSGGSEVEDERWLEGLDCAAAVGEVDGGGRTQGLGMANASVLWACTQATFALTDFGIPVWASSQAKLVPQQAPLVTECIPMADFSGDLGDFGTNWEKFYFMPQIFAAGSAVLVEGDADGQRRDIFELLSRVGVFTNRYVVNFGCRLTKTESLWYDVATGLMMELGWAGLGFDSDSHLDLIRQVAEERNRHNLTFIAELLTGETAPDRLRAYYVPIDLDLLKVDIDSFDCDLARGILLSGFRPKMLHLELSPVWPRGVRVEYRFGPKVVPFSGGCSCEAIAALGQEYGYMIISALGIDVTMIRSDLWHQHGLAKHFRGRIGCSPSCGTEYCRAGYNLPCARWSKLHDQGKHEELAREAAQIIASGIVPAGHGHPGVLAHSGNIALVSSDHVDVKFLVSNGKMTAA